MTKTGYKFQKYNIFEWLKIGASNVKLNLLMSNKYITHVTYSKKKHLLLNGEVFTTKFALDTLDFVHKNRTLCTIALHDAIKVMQPLHVYNNKTLNKLTRNC
jgi:hypothetical protein